MTTAPAVFTTKHLSKLARIHSSGAVPDESRQSLPIPVKTKDGLRLDYLFIPAVPRPNVQMLGTPDHILTINPRDGKLVQLRRCAPKDFGQTHDPTQPLGPFRLPDGTSLEEFTRAQDRLMELYDLVLPKFEAGQSVENAMRAEFQRLFKLVHETPIEPYYNAAGKDFFAWIGIQF